MTQYDPPPPYPSYPQPVPERPTERPTAKVPAWMLPAVAVVSLVLGLTGGVIAASLMSNNGSSPGGVLSVQRRTAAPLPADNRSIAAVASKVLPSTVQIVAEYDGCQTDIVPRSFCLYSLTLCQLSYRSAEVIIIRPYSPRLQAISNMFSPFPPAHFQSQHR